MKRVIIILTVSIVSIGLGYWIGTFKKSVDEKSAIMDRLVAVDNNERVEFTKDKTKEDFDSFIYKFIADSIFQIERIKFPLKSSVQTNIDELDTTSVKKSEWKTVRLFGKDEYKPQIYDNFKRELRDTDERLFCWEGIENGIYVEYKFSRINGLWFLIEYNDFSD